MKKYIPPLAVITAAFLWSLDGILRQQLYTIPSFLIITLEHAFGAILFLPFLIKGWRQVKTLNQRGWGSVLWISICGGILGTFFYTKALSYVHYIDLSVVVLLQKFQPIFAILLAAVILKEKLTSRFLVLAGVALVGGYLVTFGMTPMASWDDRTTIASLLALLAAFSWGSSTVLGKHALNKLPFQVVTSLRLTITALLAGIVLLTTQDMTAVMEITKPQWSVLILIVVSTGAVALFIYYYGLNRLPASHATIYELFWPLSAISIDWFVRGRAMSPVQAAGSVILLTAIMMLTRDRQNNHG
ncbi:MAG: DMT family transporter [Candidatus Marinimicrobia bacterium]|nr:DMT family transporter [Candidatus Neomarinimicrobiota bacterium]